MKIETFVFEIMGISPLLTHNPSGMKVGPQGPSTKKIPTPEEEAAAGCYVDAKGDYFVPSIGFRSGLIYAAGGKKFGKRSGRAVVSAAVFNDSEKSLLMDGNGKALKKYEIDIRRVTLGKASIMRCRPKFNDWHTRVSLQLDLDMVDSKIILDLLNEAGIIAGIGDYRPEKRGPFGRYTATLKK